MASEATTYFYTLVALGAVGLMLTATFQTHTDSLHALAERQELRRVLETIASEGTELIALSEATNASSRVCLRVPNILGKRRWWVRLVSDSNETWVEGAFGPSWEGHPDLVVELPHIATASGMYQGGYGPLALACSINGSDIVMTLGSWEDG